jgi:hypothetical protein
MTFKGVNFMATVATPSPFPKEENLFSKFCAFVSSWGSNNEKETQKAASLGLEIMNSQSAIPEGIQEFKDAQRAVNQIPVKQIESMEIFQQISRIKKEDLSALSDLNTLYRFLLLFNHPEDKIHSVFVKHYSFPGGAIDQFKVLPLGECSCPCGRRTRKTEKDENRRLRVEEEVLSKIEQRWGNKDQKLTLVSAGSGQCLQEWVLLSKLLLMGYKNVEIHLLDPAYCDDKAVRTALPSFFSQFPSVNFDFHFHNSLEDFKDSSVQTDVLLGIDWDIHSKGRPPVPIHMSSNGFSYINKLQPHWQVVPSNTPQFVSR